MRATASPIASIGLFLAVAFPATAQDLAGTLRIRGNVMVSSGGEFTSARDGQPVLAGQRVLVGDGASATVEYDRDCKQSFETAGVHVVAPGHCDDSDDDRRDEEDRSRQREQSTQRGTGQGSGMQGSAAASAASPWAGLAAVLGGVAATGALMENEDVSPPDHPISR